MPKPMKDETENTFISRCVPQVLEDETAKTDEQAVAICYSMWDNRDKELDWSETVYALDVIAKIYHGVL